MVVADKPKRGGRTSGTRIGNGAGLGAGYGGPAKGAGSGAERQSFGPCTNRQGNNQHTPDTAAAQRREQAEQLKDMLHQLALGGASETARVQAATAFLNRVEGMPVATQRVSLQVDPAALTDAELAAIAAPR